MPQSQFGMIGLAVMGSNLALNINAGLARLAQTIKAAVTIKV